MAEYVNVKCMVNHTVGIYVREMQFRREWIGKNSVQKIDKEVLEQIMFDPGVRYMFDHGLLYIEEMDVKKELGLEPEDAKEPVNIIVLNDKQKREVLIKLSFADFKAKVDQLSRDQVNELAQYAIDNKLIDFERDEYIKQKCGRDIISSIRLMAQDQEA